MPKQSFEETLNAKKNDLAKRLVKKSKDKSARLEKKVNRLQKENERIEVLEIELLDSQNECESLRKQVETLGNKNVNRVNEIKLLENRLNHEKDSVEVLQGDLVRQKDHVRRYQSQLANLEIENGNLMKVLHESKKKIGRLDIENLELQAKLKERFSVIKKLRGKRFVEMEPIEFGKVEENSRGRELTEKLE